uniref:Uncharacterized protein n=1 Tax=Kalanchoe fedtschenkoi TaxID=63787 RepID=A0A7N0U8X6_KALFE
MDMGMMEVEDDVFFADLNRQISLLITDDEDDGYYSPPISSYPTAVSIQAFSRTSFYPSCSQPQYQFDQIRSYKTGSDQSKGTGVFIPKSSSQSSRRRNNKHQSKINTTTANNNNFSFNSYNTSNTYKSYRQQLLSQAAFGQVINPKKS